jgi:putative heme-binding domain-containing protein
MKGDAVRGKMHFKKVCAACHRLEDVGESVGADLAAIRDRGLDAVLLNILDPNREVKPQFLSYLLATDSGRVLAGMITAETATSITIRQADGASETVLRVNIDELRSTGMSYMPEGLETQLDAAAMADLLAYLNSIQ